MAAPPPYPDSNGDTGVESGRESPPSTPLWVKVFGIAFLVLVLVFVIMIVGGHGPGRHMPGMSGAGASGQTPPSSVTANGVYQP
jgi:hypothetical protein